MIYWSHGTTIHLIPNWSNLKGNWYMAINVKWLPSFRFRFQCKLHYRYFLVNYGNRTSALWSPITKSALLIFNVLCICQSPCYLCVCCHGNDWSLTFWKSLEGKLQFPVWIFIWHARRYIKRASRKQALFSYKWAYFSVLSIAWKYQIYSM